MHALAHHPEDEAHAPVAEIVQPAYHVSSAQTPAVILGIPGAMVCGFGTALLAMSSTGGFAGIAWVLGITMWAAYVGAMGVLWFVGEQ